MGGDGGGGSSAAADQSNKLLQEQIDIQQRQYQQQLSSLSEEQFNIIKSQGGMNWNAGAPVGIAGTTEEEWKSSKS
jgi:hypothetical protein